MASSTKSAEKPAIQGTQRCNGRFLFLENDESRKPFVAAGAPNRVVCIGVNLSRAPSRHLPQVLLRSQYEHMDTRRNGECRLGYVSTSLSPGSLHSSTGGASRVCKAISRARCSAYLPQLLFHPMIFPQLSKPWPFKAMMSR